MNAAMRDASSLVPGRECGDCTACCVNLRIHSAALKKPANFPCVHLAGSGGCGIYASRPTACRSFHCGWRMLGGLGDAWRPDRSKVMIRVEKAGLVIDGLGSMGPVLARPVLQFIGTCIENGVTIYLGLPGPPGRRTAKLLLNELLAAAPNARARGTLMRELAKAIEYGAADASPQPVTHTLKRMDRPGR